MTLELDQTSVAALVWTANDVVPFEPTLRSLRASHRDLEITLGFNDSRPDLGDAGLEVEHGYNLRTLIRKVSSDWTRHVLLLTGPVIVPPGLLDIALPALDDDMRIGLISFMSNAAGYLSLPNRNSPHTHQVGPHDEVSITHLLREISPTGPITPIPLPAGSIHLLSRYALAVVDGFADLAASSNFITADFAMRAARRGFLCVADTSTYVSTATDMAAYVPEPMDIPGSFEHGALLDRYKYISEVYEEAKHAPDSPIGLSIGVAAAKIRGLRIIVEASDLGPKEMGTQVQILSLIRELAERTDVDSIQVGVPGPVPGYAGPYLASSKITTFHNHDLDLSAANHADVIHRPAQPSSRIPFDQWRTQASRVLVTLQDLVAYQIGAYATDGPGWQKYRTDLSSASSRVDGVVVISHDTLRHVQRVRLPIDPQRLFVVENGTDHLSGDESVTMPPELTRRGFLGEEFVLVLGANYSHKNRDTAIRSWQLLRHSFPQLHLVMVGAYVPGGSSRLEEARADRGQHQQLHVLPDVNSAERNWLLTHARALIYPTSAEGFGLVPFEAAKFGTPTVNVEFGPLREVNPGLPVTAASWNEANLAEATGALLADPALAAEQVRVTLANSDRYTWARTAAGLVDADPGGPRPAL